MGRKATDKTRKENTRILEHWAKKLLPVALAEGIKALSANRMAEILNCSKATIYAYSDSKEVLVEHMIAIKLKELTNVIGILQKPELSYRERCEQAIEDLATVLDPVSRLFLRELKDTYPLLWAQVDTLIDLAGFSLMEFYKIGMKEGVFRKYSPSVLWLTDQALLKALAQPDFLEQHQLTLTQAVQDFIKLKFYGLLND